MRKVFIGIPVHTGEVMVSTVISLIVSIREITQAGWDFPKFYFRVGDSDLCRARNAIIGHFLASDCTDLVLVDADVSWPPGAITKLVEHKQDFVAGAYRGRSDEKDIYFILWPEKKELWQDPDTGNPLLKVDGVSIGFARLTRECVQKLVDSLAGHYFTDPLCPEEKIPWLIDFERVNGVRYEEGYTLCRKWRELGGTVWVDPTINLGHMGPKIFEANLIEFLAKMQQITMFDPDAPARIERAMIAGLAVEPTA